MTKDNRPLCRFLLDGIQPMENRPQIDITFNIGADYKLTVTASEKSSGKERTVEVTNNDKEMFNVNVEDKLQVEITQNSIQTNDSLRAEPIVAVNVHALDESNSKQTNDGQRAKPTVAERVKRAFGFCRSKVTANL